MSVWGEQLPEVKMSPPGPRSRSLTERLVKVESPSASLTSTDEPSIFWERAAGANVEDADGNVYIDLTAAFCVSVAGHSNPRIAEAIARQAAQMMHHPGVLNPHRLRVELAERLAAWAPEGLSVSHIASTGAEANEVAMKAARLSTGRHTVVAFQGGFHGKTAGALAASSNRHYRQDYQAFLPGVVHVPYANCYRCPLQHEFPQCGVACADYLERLLSTPDSGVHDVAAVILEPIQGQGGWIVPPPEFLEKIRSLTERHGILLIVDEIITGFGRTGSVFCIDQSGVVPDIIVCAKGMASGFPISAVIMRPEIAAAFAPVQHTSTFMGNPMGCAAALAAMDEIEERSLVQRSRDLGEHFISRMRGLQEKYAVIGDVRGQGMMVGIELVRDRETKEPATDEAKSLVTLALRRGVLINNLGGPFKNVLKMSPPLVITREQLDHAIDVMDECLAEVSRGDDGKGERGVTAHR